MLVSKFKKTLLLLISISATACPSGADSENSESSLGLLLAMAGSPSAENSGSSPETVSAPAFSPAPGTYTSDLSLTLSSTTPDATIRYTTDGSSPTCATGSEYSAPIPLAIPGTRTVKAIGCKTDWTASSVISATYAQPSTAPQILSPAYGSDLDLLHEQMIVITFSESILSCQVGGLLSASSTAILSKTRVNNDTITIYPFSIYDYLGSDLNVELGCYTVENNNGDNYYTFDLLLKL